MGAKAAPAIYVTEKGQRRRAFGWDTPPPPGIRGLLGQLLPALTSFLREQGLSGKVVFHISDEPTVEHLESYRQAKELVKPLLGTSPCTTPCRTRPATTPAWWTTPWPPRTTLCPS